MLQIRLTGEAIGLPLYIPGTRTTLCKVSGVGYTHSLS